jgi:hypothetical protein
MFCSTVAYYNASFDTANFIFGGFSINLCVVVDIHCCLLSLIVYLVFLLSPVFCSVGLVNI